RTPEVNSRWDEEAQEIVRYGGVNLGIAAATGRGLVVPNVKHARGGVGGLGHGCLRGSIDGERTAGGFRPCYVGVTASASERTRAASRCEAGFTSGKHPEGAGETPRT
ncbi:2-oxo acid dehydrogenase subunit E2, partial [Agromyces humi]|uniref:2-oxo acid dehydrogenase subunit E2 n=1 Tax=Agromyces humi TaxID=1766800 RepID=UPI0019397101